MLNSHELQKVEDCLKEVMIYLDKLGKSRGIQIGLERKLREKIREAEVTLQK